VLNVALPAIGTALGASNAELQWVVTAYSVTFGGLLLTTGNLSDRVGRKKVLVAGLLLMAAGSALVVLAHTAAALIAIRALVGVGAALAMPSTLSLMYVTFAGPIRTKAVGIWSSVSLAGIVFGPLLAGFMLTRLSWQWLFAINIPVALVAVPVVLRAIPESKEATGEPTDFVGAVLSVGVLAALIYGLSSGPVEGWLSSGGNSLQPTPCSTFGRWRAAPSPCPPSSRPQRSWRWRRSCSSRPSSYSWCSATHRWLPVC
jgi:MFS transporter, DHA2 family, multidrug resistance protein